MGSGGLGGLRVVWGSRVEGLGGGGQVGVLE